MKRRNVGLRDERFGGYKQELNWGKGQAVGDGAAPGGVAQKAAKWAEKCGL